MGFSHFPNKLCKTNKQFDRLLFTYVQNNENLSYHIKSHNSYTKARGNSKSTFSDEILVLALLTNKNMVTKISLFITQKHPTISPPTKNIKL